MRMTWSEIVKKYPDQWVGLVDVEWDGADVITAIVKYTDKTRDELIKMQASGTGVHSIYTTPNNLIPDIGYLMWGDAIVMDEFTIRLSKKHQRPVLKVEAFDDMYALLDTGAIFPVWVEDEEILKNYYNAKLIIKGIKFSGFGGYTVGNVYKLECFKFGKLIYPGFHIVTSRENRYPFSMILSATMFRNLIYTIDDKNHILTVKIPDDESSVRNLIIKDSNGRINVLYNNKEI